MARRTDASPGRTRVAGRTIRSHTRHTLRIVSLDCTRKGRMAGRLPCRPPGFQTPPGASPDRGLSLTKPDFPGGRPLGPHIPRNAADAAALFGGVHPTGRRPSTEPPDFPRTLRHQPPRTRAAARHMTVAGNPDPRSVAVVIGCVFWPADRYRWIDRQCPSARESRDCKPDSRTAPQEQG